MTGLVIPLRFHDLRQGDAVRLKSGGPLMLVAIADAELRSDVHCIWTDERRLATSWFAAAVLDLVARRAGA